MSAMDLSLIILAVLVTLVVAAWVVAPLVRGVVTLDPPEPRAVALLARREAILASLRDLDADHADGRLGAADHAALRRDLVARGAATLAALDRLAADAAGRAAALAADVEAEVEALGGGARAGVAASDGVANIRCPVCGRQGGAGDRFCAGCGRRLGGEGDGVG